MGDLILREEAISTIKSMLYQTALNSVESDEKAAQLYADIADNRVETWLKLVDSVDAVPVIHAHWVEEPDRVNHWHCSNCGLTVGMASLAYKYCYTCGAKIDDKKKET